MVLVQLRASNICDVDDAKETNTIDFRHMVGVEYHTPREVVRPPPSLTGTEAHHMAMTSTGLYRFSNATSPVVIFVSSEERCSLSARFFCTRFVHYFRWIGESVQLFVASKNFQDHRPAPYARQRDIWLQENHRCVSAALSYFDSDPKLGFAATPVAVIFTDCDCADARRSLVSALPADRSFLIRYVRFSEEWESHRCNSYRFIDVSLQRQALRASRSSGSIVCSSLTRFLNSMLPTLYQLYSEEPQEGAPGDTLKSFPPIFFTRHGQSEYNIEDRLGGDPDLTETGCVDAEDIARFFELQVKTNVNLFEFRTTVWGEDDDFEVWCSQLRRTQRTAQPTADILSHGVLKPFKSLNEIHAGICEDMTNEEVKLLYPFIQLFRHTDKVGFRYPDGESYVDLVRRLTPLLNDLNNCRKCVVVVAHQAVLRTMLSFFGGRPVEEAVHAPCPQRTIWVCTMNRLGEPRLAEIALSPRQSQDEGPGVSWEGW
ncbi:fructose-6-phosphate2-kinase/fructose-2,6-bisph os phatase-likeprotein [Leishmania panamensis]|uniref:Fructose-6-phosphate2-kinase/fructose-2,6-bisph os phatase-likeprotein n=3 Tax=Leishmania guyanensis species complex TaxID=38579 RepID=A0A088S3N8_LEIPA|nr:fructose-6-phosphate2-kinase/fructose-2,6-bisph os phatase-likeprotein [Leishmania panamensis]AIO02155.1 fructose-6-phosphate2-kinase/fructose-2,6-bisph os phatase-likeprotein [Leishmania panamensis]CCM19369.1 Putative fructose-6-phosphate2-kinase/fructose-2,6-bisph os phatase-likeprotein [Leishmania guyanensis]